MCLFSCRTSTDGGQSARCDCRGLPGGPPALDAVATTEKREDVSAAQACTPGQYWCNQNGFDWIVVCNGQGRWELSSYCGKTSQGYGCCRGSSIPGSNFWCDCRNLPGGPPAEKRGLDGSKAANDTTPGALDPAWDRKKDGPQDPDEPDFCTPGRYTCGDSDTRVYVCDWNGNWQRSAKCEEGRCRRGDNHQAFCI